MQTGWIILGYIKWHYSKAILALSKIWKTILIFLSDYFSLGLLIRNLFDPWKKMNDNYPTRFNLKNYVFAFITNIIVRIVGIIMRSGLILIAVLICMGWIILYPILILGWLMAPVIILGLFILGLNLILK